MKNLIIPCCGRNFLNGKPKYLNKHPDGTLLAVKTFQKMNVDAYDMIYYVILKEDIDRFDALTILNKAIRVLSIPYQVVVLDSRTDGPAETVYNAIVNAQIKGEIVIKDLDNMLEVSTQAYGNFVAGLNLIEYENDIYQLRKKSFVIINEQNTVLDIVEKRLCSDIISAGLYGFESAADFIFAYKRLRDENYGIKHLYVSHVISYLIGFLGKNFDYIEVSGFESWGTDKEWKDVLQLYADSIKNGLVIIDLDGTLINTNDINYHAYNAALREFGFEIDYKYFCEQCNGYSYKSFLPKIMERNDTELMEEIHKRKLKYYSDYLANGKENEFLVDIIRNMRMTKYTALVTTASKKNTMELLEYFNLVDLFDGIYTSEDVKRPKPDPEGYLKAMSDFGISAEDVVVFEDADVGIVAAEKIGASCYKVFCR